MTGEGAEGRVSSEVDGAPRTSVKLFLVMTLGLFGLFSAWSVAGPIGSAPDEYQHYKYAYAIWSGQVGDDDPNYDLPRSPDLPADPVLRVPARGHGGLRPDQQ